MLAIAIASAAIGLLLAAFPPSAAAAEAAPTALDLSGVLPLMADALAALLLAVGTWAVAWLGRRLRIEHDSEVRRYLDLALRQGIEYAKARVLASGRRLGQAESVEVERDAVAYAQLQVPEAISRLRLDEEAVRRLVQARLPEALGAQALDQPRPQ